MKLFRAVNYCSRKYSHPPPLEGFWNYQPATNLPSFYLFNCFSKRYLLSTPSHPPSKFPVTFHNPHPTNLYQKIYCHLDHLLSKLQDLHFVMCRFQTVKKKQKFSLDITTSSMMCVAVYKNRRIKQLCLLRRTHTLQVTIL